jgi:hypothetical protein
MNLKPFHNIIKTAFPTYRNVFMYHMPENAVDGVLVLPPLSGTQLDPSLPNYKKAKFQVVVRAKDFESGYAKAKGIMAAFKVIKRQTVMGVFIHFAEPLHDPVTFPASKGKFIEFSINFETVYVEP